MSGTEAVSLPWSKSRSRERWASKTLTASFVVALGEQALKKTERSPHQRTLLRCMVVLQLERGAPFPLSGSDAAALLEADVPQGAQSLNALAHKGLIERVDRGDYRKHTCSTYRVSPRVLEASRQRSNAND